jgi:precorrin-6Y C5,15-methyltransferase (decarboxylating)
MTSAETQPIHVIGIDDSGPENVPPATLALIEQAGLLCGGRRHLAAFSGAAAERFVITADLDALYARLEDAASRRTVVLASGDPCFFGIGPLLVQRFGHARVVIRPAPSSVSLAFARLGLGWQDATVVSAHGRPVEAIVPAALRAQKLAILTDPEHTPAVIAQTLIAAGMPDCPAYVCERLGGAAERIREARLTSLTSGSFDPTNVIILLPSSVQSCPHAFGQDDAMYRSVRGQITKAEARAVVIAKLEPWHAETCWDVGAGSGSVAIEAAGLMASGALYAVERDGEQLEALRENVRRHRAARVRVISGTAPSALTALPEPDAVFVGGSGSELVPILRLVAKRLRPGGRLVANFALLENVAAWATFAGGLRWPSEICQISVARGEPLANGTHLSPLSPVFITRLVRPEAEE